MSEREAVVRELLDRLQGVRPGERALVALDGVDGVGKSHLAGELVAASVPGTDRPIHSVSIDGFHRPRAERRAAGTGPEGFYRGSYRYGTFRTCVVQPVRGDGLLTPAVFDVDRDQPVPPVRIMLEPDALVVVDGIFLQRPELEDAWDAVVWVDAPFTVTVPRGNARFPGEHDPDPEATIHQRYVGGQRLYLAERDPRARARWVFDNTDLDRPHLT